MDHGFAQINGKLAEIDGRFGEVHNGFAEVRGRLDGAAAGQQQIVEMLTVLINRETERPGS